MMKLLETPQLKNFTHIPIPYHTRNAGDDIQVLAFMRLFGKATFCNRDKMTAWLDDFIVPWCGWFAHGSIAPKGSAYIISTHLTPEAQAQITQNPKLKDWLIEQVKNQGFPALCRDIPTTNFFRSIGCEAEFWGCVTQRLPKCDSARNTEILDVDIPNSKNQNYITHEIPEYLAGCISCRLHHAEKLLRKYQLAAHVHTTRLHCYLPCLAFGTAATLHTEHVTYRKERLIGFM